jgi:hypothetical protein
VCLSTSIGDDRKRKTDVTLQGVTTIIEELRRKVGKDDLQLTSIDEKLQWLVSAAVAQNANMRNMRHCLRNIEALARDVNVEDVQASDLAKDVYVVGDAPHVGD